MLGGSAVFEAANALLAKIRAAAGARLSCPAEQVEPGGQLGVRLGARVDLQHADAVPAEVRQQGRGGRLVTAAVLRVGVVRHGQE